MTSDLFGRRLPAAVSDDVDGEEARRGMVLLTPEEAAAIVRLSPVTLRNMRSERRGPTPIHMGKRVYYLRRALYDWLDAEARRQADEWAAS
jgi:hypothetical protein